MDDDSIRSRSSDLSSKSQSLIHSWKNETERRKARIKELSSRSGGNGVISTSLPSKRHDTFSNLDLEGGIMSVRTLKDSLLSIEEPGKTLIQSQRKRRLLRRRLGSTIKDIKENKLHRHHFDDNFSDTNSIDTNSISTLGAVSLAKFDVSFGDVVIREYPMIPGDNPSVLKGPPLTIDWEFMSEEIHDVDVYEDFRESDRRRPSEFKMPSPARKGLLISQGFSHDDIRIAAKVATQGRRSRIRTIERMHLQPMEEFMEGVTKFVGKPFKTRKKKNQERLYKSFRKIHSYEFEFSEQLSHTSTLDDDIDLMERTEMDITKRIQNHDLTSQSDQKIEVSSDGLGIIHTDGTREANDSYSTELTSITSQDQNIGNIDTSSDQSIKNPVFCCLGVKEGLSSTS
jgi:hypothetical protein